MSGMEPEIRIFLKKIVSSVFMGLFWMMLNMTFGIYYGLLFVDPKIRIGNIIFYIFSATSLLALIWFYRRLWKTRFPHG
jgi:hypothetical protein